MWKYHQLTEPKSKEEIKKHGEIVQFALFRKEVQCNLPCVKKNFLLLFKWKITHSWCPVNGYHFGKMQ